MRKIKEVLRLKWGCGLGDRTVAESCAVARSTVSKYVRRAQAMGLSWPLPADLTEEELERRLFPSPHALHEGTSVVPDWTDVHQQLKRKDVTLRLLWEEYQQVHPDGLHYSQFCKRYRAWCGTLDLPMRQDHKAGEKMFVDYCGQTVPVTDRTTGEIHEAQIFVAVLGASSYTYVEACWSQGLPEWITAHVHAFLYFGGSSALVVPDNLKAGVSVAHRYEPEINRTYEEWAQYYDCAVIPARAYHPRDKSPVESGVKGVEQRILAKLRNRTFFSLAELNQAISILLVEYNRRPFQQIDGSRRSQFEKLDKPALLPLPAMRYEYAEWEKARVNLDYHVCADEHYYSVPYRLVKEEVQVRLTLTAVEIFHHGVRVASHLRSPQKHHHTTKNEHMPESHRAHAEWTPERVIRWVGQAGGSTTQVAEQIIASRPHPEQGFRACLGIKRLGETYGTDRLEAACQRALAIQSPSYRSVKSILENGLDQKPLTPPASEPPPIEHENVRGADYYQRN